VGETADAVNAALALALALARPAGGIPATGDTAELIAMSTATDTLLAPTGDAELAATELAVTPVSSANAGDGPAESLAPDASAGAAATELLAMADERGAGEVKSVVTTGGASSLLRVVNWRATGRV
jgi:hypothetical protein